jgi:hypothetical protein
MAVNQRPFDPYRAGAKVYRPYRAGGRPAPQTTLPAYLEKWRMQLWDLAFSTIFKGVSPFKKSDVFVDYRGSNLLVKRVIYRQGNFWFLFQITSSLELNSSLCTEIFMAHFIV